MPIKEKLHTTKVEWPTRPQNYYTKFFVDKSIVDCNEVSNIKNAFKSFSDIFPFKNHIKLIHLNYSSIFCNSFWSLDFSLSRTCCFSESSAVANSKLGGNPLYASSLFWTGFIISSMLSNFFFIPRIASWLVTEKK